MIEIVLASSNAHKVEEINAIANKRGVNFVKVKDGFDPVEAGKTFAENSEIKAREASKLMHSYALADDAGLCVTALDGRPGIYSARYASTQPEKIAKLLEELKNVPKEQRGAKFICAMVLTAPDGRVLHKTEGVCEGEIAFEPYGNGGFGYDPLFIVHNIEGAPRTMAEMSADEKNSFSHRSRALLPMIEWIKNNL